MWMTCVFDGYEHAVTEEQAWAGYELDCGVYGAVCGLRVMPQAMVCAPGGRCGGCWGVVNGWEAPPQRAKWMMRWRWLRRNIPVTGS